LLGTAESLIQLCVPEPAAGSPPAERAPPPPLLIPVNVIVAVAPGEKVVGLKSPVPFPVTKLAEISFCEEPKMFEPGSDNHAVCFSMCFTKPAASSFLNRTTFGPASS